MIQAQNLSFQIRNKSLIDQISCEFEAGKLHLIIGENGAGKSTLIKLLSGQLKPTSGKVFFKEKDLKNFSISELAKHRAVLSQSLDFAFPMRVNDVILLGRYPYFNEQPSALDLQIINDLMQVFEIEEFEHRAYDSLSGGEKQRVQFARVFAQIYPDKNESKLLFLDEPLTYLDISHQIDFMLKLKHAVREQNLTVIGVLHDLNLANRFADSLLLLKSGKLIAHGKPKEVMNEKNLETIYGITPSFIQGKHGQIIEF